MAIPFTSSLVDPSTGRRMLGMMPLQTAHQAADRTSQDMANWNPTLRSADSDWLPERDTVAARTHDIARNNGWTSGAMQSHVDTAIGANFRFRYRPDYQALGLTAEWARAFRRQVESRFQAWASDPRFYCDASERQTLSGLLGLGFRHRMVDGEALAVAHWFERLDTPWCTAIQMIDPDRLSTPAGRIDDDTMRGGIEIDSFGAPVAYHIRKAHPGDLYDNKGHAFEWERIERRTDWGRARVIHFFEPDRAGQTRGKSLLTPILDKLKMEDRWGRTELQAALVNAIFAAFIESPFDPTMFENMVGHLPSYTDERVKFHKEGPVQLDGVRIPQLFPGEKFNFTTATRPNAAFAEFERAVLRNVAAGLGMSYEQLARDWSQTNYSSARAALLESWRWMAARREHFATGFAIQIFALWLEEEFDHGDLELPKGAPRFWDAFPAWVRGRWIGPGRGWVDPVKEAEAAAMRVDYQLSTQEDEAAEQGRDMEEMFEQLAFERDLRQEYGLEDPRITSGGGSQAAVEQEEQKPGQGRVSSQIAAYEKRMARLQRRAALTLEREDTSCRA